MPGRRRRRARTVAIDAMGGDHAPGGHRRGRVPRGRRGRLSRAARRRRRRDPRLPARRRARRRGDPRDHPGDRDGRRARRRRPQEEGRLGGARRRGGARRPGRTPWSAPATPAPRWPPRCCATAASAARPDPRSACRSRCRSRRRTCSWTAARRSTARPSGWCSSPSMGRAYARLRLGVDDPTVGLLSNGEEPGKGDELRKQTYALLDGEPWFVGNVEGRDLMSGHPHVIVTDGFTGNIALKTIEGALKAAAGLVFTTLGDAGGEGGGRRRRAAAAPGRHRLPRPRHHRRRRAARRRRRVRDLARLVERPGDRQRGPARRRLRRRRVRRPHAGSHRRSRRCRSTSGPGRPDRQEAHAG